MSGNGQEENMTKKKQKHLDEDKAYAYATVSRADVRMFMGDKVADALSADDMERLAHDMSECVMESFEEDMKSVLE